MGTALRKYRQRAQLSLRAVSSRVGLSVTHLGEVERGRRPPPPPRHEVWRAIAELYGVNPEKLARQARRERLYLVDGDTWQKRHQRATD